MTQQREQWGSKIGFILAAAGSAIGLGNIWKFPYIAGENGGAAFIFIYLLCIFIIGLPVLIAEVLLGRTAQKNPVGTFKALHGTKFWTAIGGMGVLSGFIILSYYSVVAGWSTGYIIEAVSGVFMDFETASDANNLFHSLSGSPLWTVGFHGIFIGLSMFIVYSGVQKGIERGSKILMPVLLLILLVLTFKGLTLDGASAGISFLLYPKWELVTAETVLIALGHAFFTLSLGMGAMMTYGSYMSKKDSIPVASLQIVFLDTFIALIAGLAIFTVVFATGNDPGSGPGLIFQTLPMVFKQMTGGYFFSIIFFILLTIAALTSAISLLEVVVAYFVDEKGWKRHKAVIVFGSFTFLIGVPSALSFNVMSDMTIFGLNYFDISDFVSANILLPLGGMLIAVFVAWIWGFDKALANLKQGAEKMFKSAFWQIKGWKFLLKYVSPVLIFIVFLHSIGVLSMITELFTD